MEKELKFDDPGRYAQRICQARPILRGVEEGRGGEDPGGIDKYSGPILRKFQESKRKSNLSAQVRVLGKEGKHNPACVG